MKKIFRFRAVYVLLLVFCGSLLNALALELQPFLSGLSSPIYVTSANDGTRRIFVVERGGRIKVVQPDSTSTTVFLDIASRLTSSGGEQGLLGLAFHPNYPLNRRFFVNYTRRSDGATVVAEYQVSVTNRNVAATNEVVLLVISQPFNNHNGGMIEFGPDGYLYIGMGDGGDANDPGNRAQNIESLLGKMLRIDVDMPGGTSNYSSPADNPYFGPTAGRDEIFAIGLRNPWRWSFDRGGARQLYLGDVGQAGWEEIDIITLGGNYGWKIMEGDHCNPINSSCTPPPNHIRPIAEWGHTNSRCTIIGGYVYRGARGTFPDGAYISADHCSGEIFQLYPADRTGTLRRVLDTDLNFTSFGEDEAWEHYITELDGTVQRLVPSPPPTACSYGVSPATYKFGPSGGFGSATVTAGPTCAWMAASHADWITLTSGASGVGNNSVNFTVRPNTSSMTRRGFIFAAGRAIEITQSPEVRIHIARSGNNVILSWSTNAAGFVLESASSLSPQNWQQASATPVIIGSNYVVTNRIGQGAEFYRLRN